MVTIELYGAPRLRAGAGRLDVQAETLGAALSILGAALPALEGHVLRDGRLHAAYRLSLNGERFVSEPSTLLVDGDVLLLLAADVGG